MFNNKDKGIKNIFSLTYTSNDGKNLIINVHSLNRLINLQRKILTFCHSNFMLFDTL